MLATRPVSSAQAIHSSVCAEAITAGSRVKARISHGAVAAASSASEPEASTPLRSPLRTSWCAVRNSPAPTRWPTMISQAQPIDMLISSTYFSTCST